MVFVFAINSSLNAEDSSIQILNNYEEPSPSSCFEAADRAATIYGLKDGVSFEEEYGFFNYIYGLCMD
ncbi:MAG: hypothetical protein ACI9EK_003078 [Psychroserpens sp.]|jgi:hypothetical protein